MNPAQGGLGGLGPRAAAIALGFLLDRALGDPARWHPVAGFGTAAAALERAMWAPRRRRGAAFTALAVAGPCVAVGVADRVLRHHRLGRSVLLVVATWAALGGRSLEREAGAVLRLLADGDLAGARDRLPALVGRDPAGLDQTEICRAVIESVAENTPDAVVGALLWAAVGGPAGVVAYRAANTLDAMVGHHSPRHEHFGWAAARLDDALTWPAARLSALSTVVLAPVVGGSRPHTWRILRRDGPAHPSPNAGRAEAAFAGALGVTLGGTNSYPSHVEHRPRLGDGPPPQPHDIARSVVLARAVGRAAVTAILATGVTVAVAARGRR